MSQIIKKTEDDRIIRIRESERISHIEMYSNDDLYKTENWLKKPIKTVEEIIPCFKNYKKLKVLDLGCGIGRNSIAIAQVYKDILCEIECVDLLEFAIDKLNENAKNHGVDASIYGIVRPIEEFPIEKNKYDLVMAISALEHVNSADVFVQKLIEIREGIQINGIVCLVINSEVQEYDKETKQELEAQFEVNLSTKEMREILEEVYEGWQILKTTVKAQQYDIPRENGICELKTNVVTLIARKN